MKELEIECKGIADISGYGQDIFLKVTLQEVDLSFLEDVPAEEILMNSNVNDLLKAMDSSDIIDYLEENYSLKMVDVSGGVE